MTANQLDAERVGAASAIIAQQYAPVNLPVPCQAYRLDAGDNPDGDGGDGWNDDGDEEMSSGESEGPPNLSIAIETRQKLSLTQVQGDMVHTKQVMVNPDPGHVMQVHGAVVSAAVQQATAQATSATVAVAEARYAALQAQDQVATVQQESRHQVQLAETQLNYEKAIAEGKVEVAQLLASKDKEILERQQEVEKLKTWVQAQAVIKDKELSEAMKRVSELEGVSSRMAQMESQITELLMAQAVKDGETKVLTEQLTAAKNLAAASNAGSSEQLVKEAAQECLDKAEKRTAKYKEQNAQLAAKVKELERRVRDGSADAEQQKGRKPPSTSPAGAMGSDRANGKGVGSADADPTAERRGPSASSAGAVPEPGTRSASAHDDATANKPAGGAASHQSAPEQQGPVPNEFIEMMKKMQRQYDEIKDKYDHERADNARHQERAQQRYYSRNESSPPPRRAPYRSDRRGNQYYNDDDDLSDDRSWHSEENEGVASGYATQDRPPAGVARQVERMFSHARTRAYRQREAERVRMPQKFPDAGDLCAWKTELIVAANSASGRSDVLAPEWLGLAGDKSVPETDLKHVPRCLVTLDRKVSSGITSLCKGELRVSIARANEMLLEKENRTLTANELLRRVYKHLSVDSDLDTWYSFQDFEKLRLSGEDMLDAIRNRFVELRQRLADNVSERTLCATLIK